VPGMTLDKYMAQANIQNKVLADFLKKDAATIGRYRSGEVIPPLTVIVEIERFTGNAVSFRDFLPEKQGTAA
jgi:ribosome-binding protein aMBF1 (putative translation factor)